MVPSSNPPLVGYGLPQKEPKLADILLAWKTQLLIGLNCVKIGQIKTFNAATRTAVIQILGLRVMTDGSTSSYPLLNDCPVFTLQGGGASLQLPIAPGDQCLVLFNDRNLDSWFLNGTAQPPMDGRLHDLSDGIALVGLNWKASTAIAPTSTTEARLILDDGVTKIGLEAGRATVQNGTQSLAVILTSLVTQLSILNTTIATMTTATIAAGTPQAAAAAQSAAITALITDLGNLLY